MIDDILDVTQTTEMLGKTAAKDLAVNKTTYPKLVGLEKSKQVRACVRSGSRCVSCFPWCRPCMQGGGAALCIRGSGQPGWPATHDASHPWCAAWALPMQIADQLIEEAIQQLDGFEKSRAAPLIALAKFIGYRQN